jgi:hypothetical protein
MMHAVHAIQMLGLLLVVGFVAAPTTVVARRRRAVGLQVAHAHTATQRIDERVGRKRRRLGLAELCNSSRSSSSSGSSSGRFWPDDEKHTNKHKRNNTHSE